MYKKILSIFVAAVVLTLGAASLNANMITDITSELKYGANVGLTYGHTKTDAAGVDTTSGVGYSLGGTATHEVNEKLNVNLGLGINTVNSEQEVSSVKTESKLTYLHIPLTTEYALPYETGNFSFSVEGGGYIAYLLSAGGDVDKDIIYDGDYGIVLGVSAKTSSPISSIENMKMSVNYNSGLKEIVTDTKNAGFNISVSGQF
ncbi:hypothetical protein DID78_02015 [Candidatus Marinamargulisbacteria bacterium SCGC AG-343-D04]|nr:hypothetical protein DID78_02015 [Candidatus Marinamargulisbacteria bacterium SCGC AG-343-D04]